MGPLTLSCHSLSPVGAVVDTLLSLCSSPGAVDTPVSPVVAVDTLMSLCSSRVAVDILLSLSVSNVAIDTLRPRRLLWRPLTSSCYSASSLSPMGVVDILLSLGVLTISRGAIDILLSLGILTISRGAIDILLSLGVLTISRRAIDILLSLGVLTISHGAIDILLSLGVLTISRGAIDILLSLSVLTVSYAICRPPVVHCLALSIQAVLLRPGMFFPLTLPSIDAKTRLPHRRQCPYFAIFRRFICATNPLSTDTPTCCPTQTFVFLSTQLTEHTAPHPHLKDVQLLFMLRSLGPLSALYTSPLADLSLGPLSAPYTSPPGRPVLRTAQCTLHFTPWQTCP